MVSGLLSWGLPKRSLIYWQAWAPANWSEHVWGVDVAQGLVFFLPDFFVSRVASPFVLGPIVIAGFCRGRTGVPRSPMNADRFASPGAEGPASQVVSMVEIPKHLNQHDRASRLPLVTERGRSRWQSRWTGAATVGFSTPSATACLTSDGPVCSVRRSGGRTTTGDRLDRTERRGCLGREASRHRNAGRAVRTGLPVALATPEFVPTEGRLLPRTVRNAPGSRDAAGLLHRQFADRRTPGVRHPARPGRSADQ